MRGKLFSGGCGKRLIIAHKPYLCATKFLRNLMKVLIRRATIISPSSPFHGKSPDILIDNGVITAIEKNIKAKASRVIEKENLHVSLGWVDCFANFCDPGYEFKEIVESGSMAAAAGGYTQVMIIPNTNPAVSNKSHVEYLIRKNETIPADVLPIGSVTKNGEGKELGEMYDMFASGAIAFSDGLNPVQSPGIMQKALEYVLAIDATIIQLPDDKSISPSGLMNESVMSTRLGLPGKPALAEELMIARDIELARYTGSRVHFTGISAAKSLELIAAAKKEKLRVSCSVSPYHLFFCEDELATYNTNLKVNPPLRSKADRDALRNGVKKGTIDFIASHHQPQNWDSKVCEFEYAKNGMETLESVFGAALACGIPFETFIKMQTENIRKIFGIGLPKIDLNEKANITFFDPSKEYIFEEKDIHSKSKNNAFIGKKMTGLVLGTLHRNKLFTTKTN